MAKSNTLTKSGGTLVTLESLREDLPKNLRFEEIVRSLPAQDITEAAGLGDGWEIVKTEDKAKLVGVPFLLIDWQINEEGRNGRFSTIRIITADDRHLIVNDGSMKSGIGAQVQALKNTGEIRAILCRKGLKRSDFEWTDENGAKKPATTFYLDYSA
jgi:hypothetical protein